MSTSTAQAPRAPDSIWEGACGTSSRGGSDEPDAALFTTRAAPAARFACDLAGFPQEIEALGRELRARAGRRDLLLLHHTHPSLIGLDPDTVHPLFRVHDETPWRPWHLANTFLGGLFVFECWGRDYDRFLKSAGRRRPDDERDLAKLLLFLCYQYAL